MSYTIKNFFSDVNKNSYWDATYEVRSNLDEIFYECFKPEILSKNLLDKNCAFDTAVSIDVK